MSIHAMERNYTFPTVNGRAVNGAAPPTNTKEADRYNDRDLYASIANDTVDTVRKQGQDLVAIDNVPGKGDLNPTKGLVVVDDYVDGKTVKATANVGADGKLEKYHAELTNLSNVDYTEQNQLDYARTSTGESFDQHSIDLAHHTIFHKPIEFDHYHVNAATGTITLKVLNEA